MRPADWQSEDGRIRLYCGELAQPYLPGAAPEQARPAQPELFATANGGAQ